MIWFRLRTSYANHSTGTETPSSYEELADLADSDEWYKATDEANASLEKHNTWELVPLPPGASAIKSKRVFKIKRDSEVNITRYKARLCAFGYSQKHGRDFTDIFAPVFRMESLRLLLLPLET